MTWWCSSLDRPCTCWRTPVQPKRMPGGPRPRPRPCPSDRRPSPGGNYSERLDYQPRCCQALYLAFMAAPMFTAEWYSLSPILTAFTVGKRPSFCVCGSVRQHSPSVRPGQVKVEEGQAFCPPSPIHPPLGPSSLPARKKSARTYQSLEQFTPRMDHRGKLATDRRGIRRHAPGSPEQTFCPTLSRRGTFETESKLICLESLSEVSGTPFVTLLL